MSLAIPFLRGSYSSSGRASEDRASLPNLEGLLPSIEASVMVRAPQPDESPAGSPSARSMLDMMNRAVDALELLQDRCATAEAGAEQAAVRNAEQQTAALHEIAAWKSRAEAGEARADSLEARLEEAEAIAAELRSRLACLHGKLGASAETVRFQTLARALVDQTPDAADALELMAPEIMERLPALRVRPVRPQAPQAQAKTALRA